LISLTICFIRHKWGNIESERGAWTACGSRAGWRVPPERGEWDRSARNNTANQKPQFWAKPTQKKPQPQAHAEGLQKNKANILLVFMIQSGLFPQVAGGSSASRDGPGDAATLGACNTCSISPVAAQNSSSVLLN